jgi:hypothetical protein
MNFGSILGKDAHGAFVHIAVESGGGGKAHVQYFRSYVPLNDVMASVNQTISTAISSLLSWGCDADPDVNVSLDVVTLDYFNSPTNSSSSQT